ncbi:putative diguanylate cyclase [Magnetofaba australis IT-1]|uniref:diguanylate cyclase n=1 Tax=Magnetofaba australis IT-1 TaxID=1434232 RepID=A0A1Y2K0B1_9PROT|nr:putative diguanylate cyclase [Magnetofaba australis IT-1]
MTGRYLAYVLAMFLAGSVILGVSFDYLLRTDAQDHERIERAMIEHDLSNLLSFYQDLVARIAKKQKVIDILLTEDLEAAQELSSEIRLSLPGVIGVALFEANGQALGEPVELMLGPDCLVDMQHIMRGEPTPRPPVHRNNPRLVHFDITQPVEQFGEKHGVLFISFSVESIQQRVSKHLSQGRYLAIRDGNQELIAQVDGVGGAVRQETETSWSPIPGTDWSLQYLSRMTHYNQMMVLLFCVGGVVFCVAILVILFLTRHIVAHFMDDLHIIEASLSAVDGGGESTPTGHVTLQESAAILGRVFHLLERIVEARDQLAFQSLHDGLTGLFNRRAFDEALQQRTALAKRGAQSLLVVFDLDHFKQINDTYGHNVGDEVLVAFTQALKAHSRSSDILARFGGDEFVAILTGEWSSAPTLWYDRLEAAFLENQAALNDGQGITPLARISAGAVLMRSALASENPIELMKRADGLLYQAKKAGRGMIQFDPQEFPAETV